MASTAELRKFIRFQLNQLRILNHHHCFEDLCRDLARLTVCERILPATGPIAGFGDQSRDFETFRTYLSSTPLARSTFLGVAGDQTIVFQCSMQQGSIGAKIKSDIKVICAAVPIPDAIYFYGEVDIKVAIRHQIQQWCAKTFDVHLEILDGNAIAEQLTNIDSFWIAKEHLDVPAEMFPRESESATRYGEGKKRWIDSDQEAWSYSDFLEIKYGVRKATFDQDAKPDLTNWLLKMESFAEETEDSGLKYPAIYEICVASLRGLNNLTARRGLVEEYFGSIDSFDDASSLKDATVLLSYCSSATLYGHFEIEVDTLHQWTVQLIAKLDNSLKDATSPGYKCTMLQLRGQAELLQFQYGHEPSVSVDEAYKWWHLLLDEVSKAPLFPLEEFADVLCMLIEHLNDDTALLKLTKKVDELLTQRSSGNVAAAKCRDRAMVFYEAKKYTLAINQLHKAKINWFSAEMVHGSILAVLFLTECYSRLGLTHAAKYYASAAMFIAFYHDDDDIKKFIPDACYQLADACYYNGEWLNFVQFIGVALSAQNAYRANPQELQLHDDMQRAFAHTAFVRITTKRIDVNLSDEIEKIIDEWPLVELNRSSFYELCNDPDLWIVGLSLEELWNKLEAEMFGRPFSDLGDIRTIEWRALGIRWVIETANRFSLVSLAESLAAILQVIISDLSSQDLGLLPTTAKIECEIDDIDEIRYEELPSNEMASIRITCPRQWLEGDDYQEEMSIGCLTAATTVLGKCTTLGFKEFGDRFEAAYREGLSNKVFFVKPYASLVKEYVSQESFSQINRQKRFPLKSSWPFNVREHSNLSWVDSIGIGYSERKSKEAIRNRYERGVKAVKHSLPLWVKEKSFQSRIAALRAQGYLDWHILLIVVNLAISYRVQQILPQNASPREYAEKMEELIFSEEPDDAIPVPVSTFSKESVEIQKKIMLGATLRGWGLKMHLDTPDFDALEKFLNTRYRNNLDDVDHVDPFLDSGDAE